MPLFMEENLDLPTKSILNIIQNRIMTKSTYFGVKSAKSPLDFWVYQEILYEMKPDVIIEIGNQYGGTTLALAHFCDIIGKGMVIGLDIDHSKIPQSVREHPRIVLMEGDACELVKKVSAFIPDEENVLIIEDSSHTYENTLNVLRSYSKFVKPGQYLIVEDSICHHGLDVGPVPGPFEAVEAFVVENRDFIIDRSKEDFFITWNPKGYLKRIE